MNTAEKIAKQRAQAETVTHMAGANSIQRNLQREDRLAWEHQKAMHQISTGEAMPDDEDTIVNTFDSPITNHYHQPERKGMGTLGKVAIAAATCIGGPLAGVGATLGVQALNELKDGEQVTQPVDDTDTTVRLRLGRPGE